MCKYNVKEILPLEIIKEIYHKPNQKIIFHGCKINNTADDRYLNFIVNGFVCNCCGLKGSYVKLESNYLGWHFNVYGLNNAGEEIKLTKDHIYPVSKGGLNNIKNYQVLCELCNSNKKDISPMLLRDALKNGYATKKSVEMAIRSGKPNVLRGV